MSPTPHAETTRATFSEDTHVRCTIDAPPDRVWEVLVDATRYPSWTSTVLDLEGPITLGARLALRSSLDPKRTFRPKVTTLEPCRLMVWSDGFSPMFSGVRSFALTPRDGGRTEIVMTEVLSGAMLPLIRRTLPDFRPSFEAFVRDLKHAVEAARPEGGA